MSGWIQVTMQQNKIVTETETKFLLEKTESRKYGKVIMSQFDNQVFLLHITKVIIVHKRFANFGVMYYIIHSRLEPLFFFI